jgi:YidC/Oxa1 family membrane protein insertase
MEVRLILAVALSFVVFMVWGAYISKKEADYKARIALEKGNQEPVEKQKVIPSKPLIKKEVEKPQEEIPPISNAEIISSTEIKDISIETDLYKILLTNEGASFKNLKLKKHLNDKKEPLDLVNQIQDSLKPPYVSTFDSKFMDTVNLSVYQTKAESITLSEFSPEKTVSFVLETPSGLKVKKDFTFYYDRYEIDFDVNITDQNGNMNDKKYYYNWGPGFGNETKKELYVFVGPMSYLNNQVVKHEPDDIEKDFIFSGNLSWVCLQNKYFLSAMIPKNGINGGRIGKNPNDKFSVGLQLTNNSNRSVNGNITLFAGPKVENILKSYDVHLEEAVDFGWFGNKFSWLVKPLIKVLRFIYSYTHNYGVAIILITAVIKILFFPLSQKSFQSMKDMQKVQPYIKIIQERYKDDKAMLNQEMMKIYKEHKINPLGGCMPMLLQIPVFIALYNVLMVSIDLRGAPFMLWIQDLSEKDPYYITPVLMGISMFVQQKMTPTMGDPMQAKIMQFLPVIFTFMFLNFPVGLVIYWLVNNILTIAQQYYMNTYVAAK